MKQPSVALIKRITALAGVVALLGSMTVGMLPAGKASAAQITTRSLTLQAGATDGGSKPLGVVKHLFTFTIPTTGTTIHSIQFEYCTTADGTCTEPHGLVTANATLGTQTGMTFDSVVASPTGTPAGTEGSPYLTSAAGINVSTANQNVSFQLDNITNPDGTNCPGTQGACTFYVRISTYAATAPSGSPIDAGNVAASTTQQITLTGTMPESLVFCTGGTISVNAGGVPDCTTATSGALTFNADFSPTATAYTTSQFAASTNAGSGYNITVDGTTLTSGSNTITAIGSTASNSILGSGQFGMNLVLNDGTAYAGAPNIPTSANVAPAANGTSYMGKPSAGFNTNGSFTFNADSAGVINLNNIAKSDNGTGTAAPTNAQIYTASYIANVPGNQPAGTYTTTLTYICTATY